MLDNPDERYLLEMIRKYLKGHATAQEVEFIQSYYAWFEKNPDILKSLSPEQLIQFQEINLGKIWSKIHVTESQQKTKTVSMLNRSWIRAAAVAIFILGGAILYWNATNREPAIVQLNNRNDISPGTAGAVLTLADGKKLILDSSGNGFLANQGNAGVIKTDASITYQADDISSSEMIYNTLTTPRTQTYSITLSDGTKLWLNAESSVRFPAVFAGNDRRIQISGEVYLEVAKNKHKPFYVEFNKREIKVLGTEFNVNTYEPGEAMQTTLIEGSIQYSVNNQKQVLKPGDQVRDKGNNIQLIKGANTERVMAWKNGYFLFEDAQIDEVMSQLKRWYDVEILYEGTKPTGHYSGEVSRNTSLKTVLELLNRSGIDATLINKKIIVK